MSQDSCHEGVSHKVLEAAGHYFCWRCGKRIRWESPIGSGEIAELQKYLKVWEAMKIKAEDEKKQRLIERKILQKKALQKL